MKQSISKLNQLDHILYGVVGLTLGSTILSVLALSSVHATSGTASDSAVSTAHVTVNAACSMTANVTTAHTASIPNGIWSGGSGYYPNGIGKTVIQTFCNDASGYSMYAVGFTGGSMEGDNTVLHSATLGSDSDIVTGTAKSGNTSNWAMRVTKVTDSSQSYLPDNLTIQNGFDSADYHAVPANYTEVARYNSSTDKTLGSKLETTYSAYVSASQPAGEYIGKVKYTLVHPGGSDVPNVDTMQHVQYWGKSLAVGETRTVADARDNKTYTVARLCTHYDGDNCTSSQIWMTQNLDLCIGCTGTAALTSENTDLHTAGGGAYESGYSTDSNGVISWTPSGATMTGNPAIVTNYASDNPANSVTGWDNENYLPYMAEAGTNILFSSNAAPYTDLTACTTAGHTETECKSFQVGNFYNWTAAIASNNSQPINSQYTVADNSICPKGWRLPKGLTNPSGTVIQSEFNTMLSANGIAGGTDTTGGADVGYASGGFYKAIAAPYNFSRFGYINGSIVHAVGGYGHGYWWSSSASSTSDVYYLLVHGAMLVPARSDPRLYGFSIRCLARE